MLAYTKLEPDTSTGCAHPAAQPPISTTHPHLPIRELLCSSVGTKRWNKANRGVYIRVFYILVSHQPIA